MLWVGTGFDIAIRLSFARLVHRRACQCAAQYAHYGCSAGRDGPGKHPASSVPYDMSSAIDSRGNSATESLPSECLGPRLQRNDVREFEDSWHQLSLGDATTSYIDSGSSHGQNMTNQCFLSINASCFMLPCNALMLQINAFRNLLS